MSGVTHKRKAFCNTTGTRIELEDTILLEIKASDLVDHLELLQDYIATQLATCVRPVGKE